MFRGSERPLYLPYFPEWPNCILTKCGMVASKVSSDSISISEYANRSVDPIACSISDLPTRGSTSIESSAVCFCWRSDGSTPLSCLVEWPGCLLHLGSFNWGIRKRFFRWWTHYNFLPAAALVCGLLISTIVIFVATIPQWWGNVGVFETMNDLGTAVRKIIV